MLRVFMLRKAEEAEKLADEEERRRFERKMERKMIWKRKRNYDGEGNAQMSPA